MTDTTVAATKGSTKSDKDKADKESGSSLADDVIAVGTMIGGVGTTVLAGISAIPVLGDATGVLKSATNAVKSGFDKVIGSAERMFSSFGKTLTSTMKTAIDDVVNELGNMGLNEADIDSVLQKVLAIGKNVTSGEIESIIVETAEKAGTELEEGAAKVAADALEVTVKAIL